MKFNRVAWLDGDILYVEHLENSSQMLAEYVKNYTGKNEYGIRNLKIDQIAFSSGLLSIKEVDCLFPDGSFVSYISDSTSDTHSHTSQIAQTSDIVVEQPSTSYFIQPDDAIQGKQLYLGITGEDISNREINLQDGTVINMPVRIPKLGIFTDPQENRVPLLKILLKGGMFVADEASTRLLQIDVKKQIEGLVFNLQNLFLIESDKSEVDNLFLSHINCAISTLIQINNENEPYVIYKALISCLGNLSWKTGKPLQTGGNYSLDFPLRSVNFMIQRLNEILEYLSVSYKKIEFVQNGTFLLSSVNNFEGYENMIIVAEPYSEEGVQELFSCIICSESMIEDARKKRTFGMTRQKNKDEMKFVIPLRGPFFHPKEKMICSINISKFTRIAFYIK